MLMFSMYTMFPILSSSHHFTSQVVQNKAEADGNTITSLGTWSWTKELNAYKLWYYNEC